MTARPALWLTAALTLAACSAPAVRVTTAPPLSLDLVERFRLEPAEPAEGDEGPGGEDGNGRDGTAGTLTPNPSRIVGSLPADPTQDADEDGSGDLPLALEHVLLAAESHFPLIAAAMEEVEIAAAGVQSAEGAFDTKLTSKNVLELDGYYEGDRYDVGFEQPTTLYGASFEGGWRMGKGSFADYDGKAKTNDDGEFRLGVSLPLLQGGSIDPQRVAMWQARLAESSAEPLILEKRLSTTAKAASAYWSWVAAGARRGIAEHLVDLAEEREGQLQEAVDEGLLAEINLVDNERLIVERRTKLIRAERSLEQAAIALSLFWRDVDGDPLVPRASRLPLDFPAPRDPIEVVRDDDLQQAVARRPEVLLAQLRLETLEFDLELAQNQRLAALDVGFLASKDVGSAVDSPDDKGPFELEARVGFSLPLQRRKARGAERKAAAKIAKVQQELRFSQDLVISEVRDLASALQQSWQRIGQARESVRLAGELEQAERLQLLFGESDLFRVNVREQQAAAAAATLVDATAEHFRALAGYRAALGMPYDEVRAGWGVGGGEPAPDATRS